MRNEILVRTFDGKKDLTLVHEMYQTKYNVISFEGWLNTLTSGANYTFLTVHPEDNCIEITGWCRNRTNLYIFVWFKGKATYNQMVNRAIAVCSAINAMEL